MMTDIVQVLVAVFGVEVAAAAVLFFGCWCVRCGDSRVCLICRFRGGYLLTVTRRFFSLRGGGGACLC